MTSSCISSPETIKEKAAAAAQVIDDVCVVWFRWCLLIGSLGFFGRHLSWVKVLDVVLRVPGYRTT